MGALEGCSEKSPWLGKRLETEIKNRKLQETLMELQD